MWRLSLSSVGEAWWWWHPQAIQAFGIKGARRFESLWFWAPNFCQSWMKTSTSEVMMMTHLAAFPSAAWYVAIELHLYIDLYVKRGYLLETSNINETSTSAAIIWFHHCCVYDELGLWLWTHLKPFLYIFVERGWFWEFCVFKCSRASLFFLACLSPSRERGARERAESQREKTDWTWKKGLGAQCGFRIQICIFGILYNIAYLTISAN